MKRGLYFITDEDARPLGSAHPHAHLWDNGPDAVDELNRILDIRTVALKRFGEAAIRTGEPLAELDDKLVPLYHLHRYQTEAAAKLIGGLDYRYAVRGDGQTITAMVRPEDQRKALAAVLKTLSPDTLTLPESLLKILPPVPSGTERTRESFASHTGLTFDPVAAAESSADLTLALLFNPQRASRLVEYHGRDTAEPSLEDVIDQTLAAARPTATLPGLPGVVATLSSPARSRRCSHSPLVPRPPASARAVTAAKLDTVKRGANPNSPISTHVVQRIEEYQRDPEKFVKAKSVDAPPGMPIGTLDGDQDSEVL